MVLRREDWIGKVFGRLTVINVERVRGRGSTVFCQCACGVMFECNAGNLRTGNTQSCGCLWKTKITTHGRTKSRVYGVWKAIRGRCYSPNALGYKNYGGRGIKVCDRWKDSFENFYADMGDPPKGYTIERIDNDGDYAPDNCRWATYTEQHNNKRTNAMITAFGKTQSLTLWARERNIPITTLKNRLSRAKMNPEDALTVGLYAQQRSRRK